MTGWRLAGSLVKLRDQINSAHPNRSKASDGTIGDAAHRADSTSDHNPNGEGVVTAFDITHDPANGVDIDKLSDALANSHDPRIKYLIANNLICVPDDYGDWDWHPYSGADPHTNHLHISVYKNYDNTSNWEIGEEDMKKFNEGDRKNKNTALYGVDLGRFKFAVGMEYDLADYAIMKSDEFMEDALLNRGDLANLREKLKIQIPDSFIGKPSKSLLYWLKLSTEPQQATKLKPGLYQVEG